jgi:hypothetical protein
VGGFGKAAAGIAQDNGDPALERLRCLAGQPLRHFVGGGGIGQFARQ